MMCGYIFAADPTQLFIVFNNSIINDLLNKFLNVLKMDYKEEKTFIFQNKSSKVG